MRRLTERHLRLYRVMWTNAYQRRGRRPVCDWPQHKLAAALGCSTRTLQRLIADLRQPGPDVRHPGTVAKDGARVGWVSVYPQKRRDGRGGHTLRDNRYVLNVDLLAAEARVRGECSHPAEVELAVAALADAWTSPEGHPSSSNRSDTREGTVPAGQIEATSDAVSLTPAEVVATNPGTCSSPPAGSPRAAPSAAAPPSPGSPGYRRWEEHQRNRQLAELERAYPDQFKGTA